MAGSPTDPGTCGRGPGEASTSTRPDRVSTRRGRSPGESAAPVPTAGVAEAAGGNGGEASDSGGSQQYRWRDRAEDPNEGVRGSGECEKETAGDAEMKRRRTREGGLSCRPGRRGGITGALRTVSMAVYVCVLAWGALMLPVAMGSLYGPAAVGLDGADGTAVTVPTAVTATLPETTGSDAAAKLSYAAYYSISPWVGVAAGGTLVRARCPLLSKIRRDVSFFCRLSLVLTCASRRRATPEGEGRGGDDARSPRGGGRCDDIAGIERAVCDPAPRAFSRATARWGPWGSALVCRPRLSQRSPAAKSSYTASAGISRAWAGAPRPAPQSALHAPAEQPP
jgi:hypothetical protein